MTDLKKFLPSLQNAMEIAKKVAGAEDKFRLLEVLSEATVLAQDNAILQEEKRQLEKDLAFNGELVFEQNALWLKDKPRRDPYCSGCWEAKRLAVHLHALGSEGLHFKCPSCGKGATIRPGATSATSATHRTSPDDPEEADRLRGQDW